MSEQPEQGVVNGGRHRLPVRVYYEDTDFTGVIYYANYLKFMERGRTDFLRCAGIDHAELAAADPPLGFAVREARLKFHQPARIDDALIVETLLIEARGARIIMAQRVLRGDHVLTEGDIQMACIDFAGRPRRLPATVADRITSYQESVQKSS